MSFASTPSKEHSAATRPRPKAGAPRSWFFARPANPKVLSDWLTRQLHELDPELPVTITTMQQRVSKLAQRPRFNALLLALFAGMGALLAAIGLYGVMAFLVGQRTQEIGVRMALGATPSNIARLVLSRAALWTLTGALLGLAGVLFATRALRSLLFEVSEHDALTFVIALLGLAADRLRRRLAAPRAKHPKWIR